jgi:MFS family permease
MVSALVIALPAIADEFSADAISLGWLTTVFFLSAAAFLVPLGRIADMYGVKKVFVTGIGVYLLSSVLSLLAPSIQFLIAARFITGIGGGMIFGTSIALLSLAFPESERGKAIGWNVTGMFAGFLLGFFLGGLLTYYVGWRSLFALTVPVELLVMGLIYLRIRGECELSRRRELDIPGMVLYSLSVLLLMAGFSALPGTTGGVAIACGVLSLCLFVLRELRAGSPTLDVRLFLRNRTFASANLAALLFNTSNFAVIFLLSLYLQDIRGFDARYAGTILLTTVVFMAVLSPYAGRLSDRVAPPVVTGSGVILSSTALLILAFLSGDTPLPLIILALALLGTGFALFQSPLLRTLVASVGREMYGLASGMIETMRLAGMTISVAITTLIFAATIGSTHITPELSGGFTGAVRLILWIFLGISLAALPVTLLMKTPAGR